MYTSKTITIIKITNTSVSPKRVLVLICDLFLALLPLFSAQSQATTDLLSVIMDWLMFSRISYH